MLNLQSLENDFAEISDRLRSGLTHSRDKYDIDIKFAYDDSDRTVKILQNGSVIKTVDYTDEAHTAEADAELSSYVMKLTSELAAL